MMVLQKIGYVINAYLGLFVYFFTKKKPNVWVIGGHNGNLYTDNAKVYYEYILANHPDIAIYWIADKSRPVWNKIKGNKLAKGSVKSYAYFYNAEASLFSDTFNSDIAPFIFILPLARKLYYKCFKVYLGHGTIALKKMPKQYGLVKLIKSQIFNSYDLAIAATNLERNAMQGYGIKESAIVVAGSARHDSLVASAASRLKSRPVIFVAPTWREWLAKERSLKKTEFYAQYYRLLTDKALLDFLRNNKIVVSFYLHHMFHRFECDFALLESEFVRVCTAATNVDELVASSNMLITDYSSMASDFFYLKKPVLFFQFDKNEYIEKVGSEIDLNNDVFGDVCCDVTHLIRQIISTVSKGYVISPSQMKGEKYFINYTDRNNCHRITAIVKKKMQEFESE